MVFGLFSKDRALKRIIEKATSKLAQSPDRWAAMEKLSEEGSDEALAALCKRFSFTCDKMIEDQKEKAWATQTLVAKGDRALGPLRLYMKTASSLGYPLQILERITANIGQTLEVVDELLRDEEPGYTNDPKRRIDIIEFLSELDADDGAIASRVAPYLADFDENVRFKTVEAIGLKPHANAGEPLAAALVNDDEESRRLKVRMAEVLAENSLDLGEHKSKVAALLTDVLSDFKLHRDKLQKKA